MQPRFNTLEEIEQQLSKAIHIIRTAQAQNANFEAATWMGNEEYADDIASKYGESINNLVEVLLGVKNQLNQYLDEDEFFMTDRL